MRLRADDVGMLLGVALQQPVEVALQRLDPAIDLRAPATLDGRGRRVVRQQDGLLARDLALERVARLLGFAQLEPRLVELRASARSAA